MTWDVFVSHSSTDEAIAQRLTDAMRAAGLRVFLAVDDLQAFTAISSNVLHALHHSKVLLAYYSPDYPTRHACQREFADAYLAGQAEGDPLARIVAINPDYAADHVQPRRLRDAVLPGRPVAPKALAAITAHVRARVSATDGVIGDVATAQPKWVRGQVHPSARFVGRWDALWRLHSALHPYPSPLTHPQTAPTVVLHGVLGIGKTALAAEYVRRFGCSHPDGVVWLSGAAERPTDMPQGSGYLWVLDDVTGEPDRVRAVLPRGETPCLVITRDPRLAALANAVQLADLDDRDAELLVAAHLDREQGRDPESVGHLARAAQGSPGLRVRVAELAAADGLPAALRRLAHPASPLTEPLGLQLIDGADDRARDVLRVLAATSPTAVAVTRIADVLAAANRTDRITELDPVQRAVTRLACDGLVAGGLDAVDVQLPAAHALAVRRGDPEPERAEHIRACTLSALARPAQQNGLRRLNFDDEELRSAARIQADVVNRVPYRLLPPNQGSLRGALSSMHTLLGNVRTTRGLLHPSAARSSNGMRPGLGSIVEHLVNELLRDFLLAWDQELGAHEDGRPPTVSRIAHERAWPRHDEMRAELTALRDRVTEIAFDLATITGDTHGLPGVTR